MDVLNLSPTAFRLLEDLEQNNTREWFEAHKKAFTAEIREPFTTILEMATLALAKTPTSYRGSKKTLFRQNRDTRFSTDKSPYKTNVSGLLTRSGLKRETKPLIYLHLDSGGGFLACGIYKLSPKELEPIRAKILTESTHFAAIAKRLEEANLPFMTEGKLRSMPRGFEEASDHPLAEYVKLKSYCVSQHLTINAWQNGKVVEAITSMAVQCRDLLAFLEGESP